MLPSQYLSFSLFSSRPARHTEELALEAESDQIGRKWLSFPNISRLVKYPRTRSPAPNSTFHIQDLSKLIATPWNSAFIAPELLSDGISLRPESLQDEGCIQVSMLPNSNTGMASADSLSVISEAVSFPSKLRPVDMGQMFDMLPMEVKLYIFSQLDVGHLVRALKVSRLWNKVGMDGSLWAEIHSHTFPQRSTERHLQSLINRAGSFLRILNTRGNSGISSNIVMELAQNCSMLRSLDLRGCRSVSSTSLSLLLASSPRLQNFNTSGLAAVDDGTIFSLIMGNSLTGLHSALKKSSTGSLVTSLSSFRYLVNHSSCGKINIGFENGSTDGIKECLSVSISIPTSNTYAWKRSQKNGTESTCNYPAAVGLAPGPMPIAGCFRNLTHLNLSHCRNVTSEGLQLLLLFLFSPSLGSRLTLTHLYLSHLNETLLDDHLLIIGGRTSPEPATAGVAGLKHLAISYCSKITDRGIRALTGLSRSHVAGHPVDERDREMGQKETDVLWIEKGYPHPTESSAFQKPHFRPRKSLVRLCMQGCDLITDASLAFISLSFPSLVSLELGGCRRISDEGLKQIVERCSKIVFLDLEECIAIGDATIESVTTYLALGLKRISLGYCDRITEASVWKLIRSCPNLKHIEIDNCSRISDNLLHLIRKNPLRHLRTLELYDCRNISFSAIRDLQRSNEEEIARTASAARAVNHEATAPHLAATIETTTGISVSMLLTSNSVDSFPASSQSSIIEQASIPANFTVTSMPEPLRIRSFYTSRVNDSLSPPVSQLQHVSRSRMCVIL